MGAALTPGADAAVLAGGCARAGDAEGPARPAGVSAAARTGVGSRRWATPTLVDRARAMAGQLHAAIGGAGVRDRAAGQHGQPGDQAGPARVAPLAWPLSGPGQGVCAADPGALAGGPLAGSVAEY